MIYEKIILGISFAAPLGPVGTEALRRGLKGGFWPAFGVKIGAAAGDTLCLIAAYFGLHSILKYEKLCLTLAIFGSALLIYFGYSNIKKTIKNCEKPIKNPFVRNSWLFGFSLSLTNPFALAWWLSIFSAFLLDSGSTGSTTAGLIGNLYIIVGIIIWDIIFCLLLEGGKRIMNDTLIKIITLLAGVSLCGYGIFYGGRALAKVATMI